MRKSLLKHNFFSFIPITNNNFLSCILDQIIIIVIKTFKQNLTAMEPRGRCKDSPLDENDVMLPPSADHSLQSYAIFERLKLLKFVDFLIAICATNLRLNIFSRRRESNEEELKLNVAQISIYYHRCIASCVCNLVPLQ